MISATEIRSLIKALDDSAVGDQTALHQGFGSLSLDYSTFPIDVSAPNSPEYRARQFEIYEAISGRAYSLSNEEVAIDIDAAVKKPFPYNTANLQLIGDHHATLGFLFTHFDMPPGSRVFEMGIGWGNLCVALAKTGYLVGGCDLEERFVDLARKRAVQEGVAIDLAREDFLNSRCFSQDWDAIIFNACFHHCSEPQTLLDKLAYETKDDIRLYFLGESFYRDYPWPWGLNLHGQAVYCINKFGWLELAFNEEYFLRELYSRGLAVRRWAAPHADRMTLFKASKISSYLDRGHIPFAELCQPQRLEQTFAAPELDAAEQGRWSSGLSRFEIPDPRLKSFELILINHKPVTVDVICTHKTQAQSLSLYPGQSKNVLLEEYSGEEVQIWSETHHPKAMGWSADDRNLGIYVVGIRVVRYD